MIFWDSSALLPLIVEEPTSRQMADLYENSESVLIWTLTPVEVVSSLARLRRQNELSEAHFELAMERWNELQQELNLIQELEAIKRRASRVLLSHPLKAADSLQLAAALVACSDQTASHRFVTLDDRLARAAKSEGFITTLGDANR